MSNGSDKPNKNQDVRIKSITELQVFKDHADLSKRLRKTLYYAKFPSTDRPSLPLSEIAVELFSQSVPRKGLEVLDMHYAASVSRRACVSPCSMMLAMVYLEHLRCRNPEYLQAISSCDLFLISMLVASKYLYEDEDDDVFNGEWATSANIDIKDLNRLEREFLAAMNWELFVKPEKFNDLLHKIESCIALQEAANRGWLTYMDIWVLTNDSTLNHCWNLLMENVVKVVVVSTLAYAAAALTLLGAAATLNHIFMPQAAILQRVWNQSSPTFIPTLIPLSSLKTEVDHSTNELPDHLENLQVDAKGFCASSVPDHSLRSSSQKQVSTSTSSFLPKLLSFCQELLQRPSLPSNCANKTFPFQYISDTLPADNPISRLAYRGDALTT